jgi:hypothetical protein
LRSTLDASYPGIFNRCPILKCALVDRPLALLNADSDTP